MKDLHAVVLQGEKYTRFLNTVTTWSSSSSTTSVLDTTRSPSSPTSSSTSLGGGGGGGRCTALSGAAVGGEPPPPAPPQEWSQQQQHQDTSSGSSNVDIDHPGFCTNEEWCSDSAMDAAGDGGKCGGGGMGADDWFSSLPEAAPSPGSEQSILRLIMGEVEDASLFQMGGAASVADLDFNVGFGVWDHGFVQPENLAGVTPPAISAVHPPPVQPPFSLPTHLPPAGPHFHHIQFQPSTEGGADEKPQVFNPRPFLNHGEQQSPYFFWPQNQRDGLFSPTPAQAHPPPRPGKRHQMLVPQSDVHRGAGAKVKRAAEDGLQQNQELQQAVMEHLYQAAEMVEMGNPALAQGILARLNHQLSPVGRPFQRAAFYFKEALLQTNKDTKMTAATPATAATSFTSSHHLLYKIGAYKSFSEISPILHFAHFTCMQSLLEALHGSHHIHILDFDIGYGGQWASLMQELALRNNGGNGAVVPSLKITAFVSAATHCELELGLTRDNLRHFAAEVGLPFIFQVASLESLSSTSLWPPPVVFSGEEAVAVNLQVGSAPLPAVLGLVKEVGARIVVCLDRGQERWEMSFAQHLIYSLQLQWAVLESLEAMSVNFEAVEKIERFLVNPEIEKMVSDRRRLRRPPHGGGLQEKAGPWRSLFLSSGFSPMPISNFNESQAACVVKRSPVHGFHVEKRHSSLVLCWQSKELISASAWTCY